MYNYRNIKLYLYAKANNLTFKINHLIDMFSKTIKEIQIYSIIIKNFSNSIDIKNIKASFLSQ